MQDMSGLRDEALRLDRAEFVARHGSPVVIARQLLAGELRERAPLTRPRRRTPPTPRPGPADETQETRMPAAADSIYSGTMAHVKPRRLPGRPVDAGVARDLELSGQRYAPLCKAPHTPPFRPVTLGRSEDADVVLPDFTVSGEHAHVVPDPDGRGFSLVDLGSTNGTWVGGRKLVPGRPHPIRSGERLVLGRLVLRFLTPQDFHRFLSAPRAGDSRRRA
ncbi:MAG: FHA domain-containing protein [Myxococcota bacterium]